jgi:hypothetical protein
MARGIVRSGSTGRRHAAVFGHAASLSCLAPLASFAFIAVASAVSANNSQTSRRSGQDGHRVAGSETSRNRACASGQPTWGARLLAAPRLQARLALLSDLGLSDSEIAQVFPDGGSVRSVRRWRLHGMTRDREAARWTPIDNLCAIVGYLMSDGTFDEDATVAWLRSRQIELGHRRPLQVLGTDNFAEVLDAAESSLGMVVGSADDVPGPISRAMAAKAGTSDEKTDTRAKSGTP